MILTHDTRDSVVKKNHLKPIHENIMINGIKGSRNIKENELV